MAYYNAPVMHKWLRMAYESDKTSVGDNAITQVVVTVCEEKYDGENKVIWELEIIFNHKV